MVRKDKLIFALIIVFILSISFSCNPQRRGRTASQIGAGSGMKFHKKTATAKRKKIVKY